MKNPESNMADKQKFFTRRRLIKGIGVTAGAGAIGGASLVYSSQPALAASGDLNPSDVTVDTTDGGISDVYVTPALTVDWGDFSGGVSGFDITVSAGTSEGSTTSAESLTGISADSATGVSTFALQDGGALTDSTGTVNIDLTEISFVGTDNPLGSSDLPSTSSDGGSDSTTIYYEVEVVANSTSANTTGTDTVTGDFAVTVNDTGGTSTVGGDIDAGASE